MRDRLFSGADVEEALAAAAASLGLPIAELRYVVLEPGGAGGRGLNPTPARIAVMVQEPGYRGGPERRQSPPAPGPAVSDREAGPRPPVDVKAGVRAVVRAVAEAGRLDLSCEIEEEPELVVVRLGGPDAAFFHGEDGRGEELRALEHLLQRMYAAVLHPRWLRLEAAGLRERRAQALAEEARSVAASVRQDGHPRSLEPMNSYERRLVHLALQGEPGITTYSVGEGGERRVTIGPTTPGAASGSDAPPDGDPDGR